MTSTPQTQHQATAQNVANQQTSGTLHVITGNALIVTGQDRAQTKRHAFH